MFTVYTCVVHDHDLRLVALAALICALASITAITLIHHVRKSLEYMRYVWLSVSALATGFGIWATHFIAMLAYAPGVPSGYNVSLTLASLVFAIVATGAGFAVALSSGLPGCRSIGGMIVGGGIALMHFTGMSAFEIAGRIVWDPVYVVVSIMLAEIIGATALSVGLRDNLVRHRVFGALLLTAAICSLHFTAMAAVAVVPIPPSRCRARRFPRIGSQSRSRSPASRSSFLRLPDWRSTFATGAARNSKPIGCAVSPTLPWRA